MPRPLRAFTFCRGWQVATLSLCLLTSCQPPKGAVRGLTVVIPSAPLGLFPNTANEDVTMSIMSNIYESLVDLDPALQLRPGLAESWYTSDETTWVFRLRKDVRLHDGRVLSAQDVATSLNQARTDPNSRRSVQLAAVLDVRAEGSTVVVKTNGAFNALPLRLANVFVWAVGDAARPVGTGPYRLASSTPAETVLEAFDGYRLAPPSVRRIVFRVVPDIDARERLMESGGAEFMLDVPADRMKLLKGRMTVQAIEGLRVFLLGLSCRDTLDNPFRDVRVRRAVAIAIDRQGLAARSEGYAQAVDGIVSPEELGGHHARIAFLPYDPDKARALLREAGHPDGLDVDLNLSIKYRYTSPLLDALVGQLGRVGVRAHLQVLSAGDYILRLEQRAMTMFLLGWLSDTGDGRVSYDYLLHSRSGSFGVDNGSEYSNPQMDSLIESASRTNAPDTLGVIFAKLDQQVVEDVPLIPLFRQDDLYAYTSDLIYTPRLDRRLRFEGAHWK
jgi:peptide/nickel transport system substrate-binding protein